MLALAFAKKRDFVLSIPNHSLAREMTAVSTCLQAAVSILAEKPLSPCTEAPRSPSRVPSPVPADLLILDL